MAKNEFFGLNDSLWGGETFTSRDNRSKLAIKKGDRFRIEMGEKEVITLIPHPKNVGTWNKSHSKTNPIKLTEVDGKPNKRAFSMMVQTTKGSPPQQLFLVERNRGGIAIKKKLKSPGNDDGTCSVEH